jgi:hypothetical protein
MCRSFNIRLSSSMVSVSLGSPVSLLSERRPGFPLYAPSLSSVSPIAVLGSLSTSLFLVD